MKLIDQIQTTIQNLPEEAQQDLWEYVQNLSHKYSLSQPTQGKSLYEKFEEKDLIGCFEDDEDISTNYKQILTESLEKKYGYR
jgi:hypothetical protein